MSGDVEVPTRLIVHALIRDDGTVDAGELYDVSTALGMTDQQMRLCIKRLVAEGKFSLTGRGRKALLQATASADDDVDFVAHAYRQDAGLAPWDGVWHLAAFAVPESARSGRDALRETLVRLGGALLQGGLYVCANAWESYVETEARRLEVFDGVTLFTSTDLRRGATSDPVELAAQLWPQQEIADRYRRLAAVARPRLARLTAAADLPPVERLTIAVELAAEFSRAMKPDPLLPPELLPRPWVGVEARALVAQCWTVLRDYSDTAPRIFRRYSEEVIK